MIENNDNNNEINSMINITKQRLLEMIFVDVIIVIRFISERQESLKSSEFIRLMRFDAENEENNDDKSSIRVKDVNYFDSKYFENFNVFIVNVEKHVYYRDVFVFINKLKDVIK